MKVLKYLIFLSIVLVATECELFDDSNLSPAERLEGTWMVEEELLKSADDSYRTEIFISPIDSNTIMIDNFLDLREGAIYAKISGMSLTVPEQVFGNDWTVRGSATISSGYNQMTWGYQVDDGSGIWESYSAIYTKIDLY